MLSAGITPGASGRFPRLNPQPPMMREQGRTDGGDQAATIFRQALGFKGAERAAYLAGACGTDTQLRQRVETLFLAEGGPAGDVPPKPLEASASDTQVTALGGIS